MELLIGDVIANAARVAPGAVAATLGEDQLSFATLDASANQFAHALAGFGVGHRDRVLWWGDTSLDALPVFGALARVGAVFAPLNARLSAEEAEPIVEHARPRLLLADSEHRDLAEVVAARTGVPLAQLGAGAGSDLGAMAAGAASTGFTSPTRETDPHVVFFTSGSTGRPKGVVLSHRANWLRTAAAATTTSGGRGVVCMFPLFHMAGWTIALGAWQARRPVHFVAVPDAPTLLATAERHRASRLYCIPAVWSRILDHGLDAFDLRALEEADTGTSATPPELLTAIKHALPHTVTRVFYGSTEAGPGVQLGDDDLFRKPGSVGVAQPGVDVRISDDGEVCLRSPYLFDGYLDDPDATAAALVDGWYRTGDRGVLDADGYLSIVGRLRDVIRSGGETVAPAEVETALATHPAVAEAAVVGVPDPQWGEVVTAVVVVRIGVTTPTLDDLRAHCADRLASYKHPRRLAVVTDLPRTAATGQVQRTLLVERLQSTPSLPEPARPPQHP